MKNLFCELEEDSCQIQNIQSQFQQMNIFPYQLRQYQIKAIEAWIKNNHQGTIQIFCGLGKSIIAYFAIIYSFINLDKHFILVCFPQIQLIYQFQQQFQSYLQNIGIIVKLIFNKSQRGKQIQNLKLKQKYLFLSTYDSAKLLQDINIDFAILDECHHSLSEQRKHVRNLQCLKLSATPNPEEKDIIFNFPIKKALEQGFLCDFEIKVVSREFENKEQRFFKFFQNVISLMKIKGKQFGISYSKLIFKKSFFNTNAKEFLEYEIPNTKFYFIEASQNAEQRKTILQNFQTFEENIIKIIFNAQLLIEGVDLPCADTAIFNDNSHTVTKITQIIGRLMRPFPNKNKSLVIIPTNEVFNENDKLNFQAGIFTKLRRQFVYLRSILKHLSKFPELFDYQKFQGIFSKKHDLQEIIQNTPVTNQFFNYYVQNNQFMIFFLTKKQIVWNYVKTFETLPEQKQTIYQINGEIFDVGEIFFQFKKFAQSHPNREIQEQCVKFIQECEQYTKTSLLTIKQLRNLANHFHYNFETNIKDFKFIYYFRRKTINEFKNSIKIFRNPKNKQLFLSFVEQYPIFEYFPAIDFYTHKSQLLQEEIIFLSEILPKIPGYVKEQLRIKKKILDSPLFQKQIIYLSQHFTPSQINFDVFQTRLLFEFVQNNTKDLHN